MRRKPGSKSRVWTCTCTYIRYLNDRLRRLVVRWSISIKGWKIDRIRNTRLGRNTVQLRGFYGKLNLNCWQKKKQKNMKHSYPSATGKLLCVLLKPGEGELLTYVTSGQGQHCRRTTLLLLWLWNNPINVSLLSTDTNWSIPLHLIHLNCLCLFLSVHYSNCESSRI